jgi:hypothetical protein
MTQITTDKERIFSVYHDSICQFGKHLLLNDDVDCEANQSPLNSYFYIEHIIL